MYIHVLGMKCQEKQTS